MSRDYYQEARTIAGELSDQGLADQADILYNTIDAGSTGTEILMGLRSALRKT